MSGSRTRSWRRLDRRLARHLPYIRAMAARLAKGERDLFEDLVQEGVVAAWLTETPLVERSAGAARYLALSIRMAMLRFVRGERRRCGGAPAKISRDFSRFGVTNRRLVSAL